MEDHIVPFGSISNKSILQIPHNGDLVGHNLYIVFDIPKVTIKYKNTIAEEKLNYKSKNNIIDINNISIEFL